MLQQVKRVLADERGMYGGVEVMLIVGAVAVIGLLLMGAFKGNGSTTGLPGAANSVANKIQNTIDSASQ